jgi:hypothetical protein
MTIYTLKHWKYLTMENWKQRALTAEYAFKELLRVYQDSQNEYLPFEMKTPSEKILRGTIYKAPNGYWRIRSVNYEDNSGDNSEGT